MKNAVIYLLSGEKYIDEAVRSVQSIKKHNNIPCILCTPDNTDKGQFFDDLLPLPERKHKLFYVDATEWWYLATKEIDAKQFLLLDADTFSLGSLDDYYDILGRFDFTGVHAVGRQTMVQRDDIPQSFPELHIGANSFVKNKKMLNFLSDFYELFRDKADYFGNNDQGPLREALWTHSEVKLAVLPTEFCFRYRFGGQVTGDVKLIHGHENNVPYENIVRDLQKENGIRVFHKRELA